MAEEITENSQITQYKNSNKNSLCVKANDRESIHNTLKSDKEKLLEKYPKFETANAAPNDFFDTIIQKEFVDGIPQEVYIRNYTLVDDKRPRLAIRPKRTPHDYLSNILPDNKTLLFKGFVTGKSFIVDSVFDQYNENLLDYEVECSFTRYDDESRCRQFGGNFLDKVATDAASLNEHTTQRLNEWKYYIKWRRKIVEKRMEGALYVNVEVKGGNFAFTLQFPSKADYESKSKWLKKGELAAYDFKEYHDENGNFKYDVNRHPWEEKFKSVGKSLWHLKKDGREKDGHYEIELIYSVPDNDDLEEMTQAERDEYIQNKLLPNYPPKGFLAPLVIKDLSLYRRLDNAVTDLQEDRNCRSPNMAMWIFDVRRARLPLPQDRQYWENLIGDNWLNADIAGNPNQREAIFKMLEAPDLCLIQGPPGTGKTTVIAEAIYQFARQGMRVLLASQSHDAVDNALDRLADRSEIRAVRLNERDRDRDEEHSKFSQFKVLSTYYGTLSQSVANNFLTPWNKNRQSYTACESELRDFHEVTRDLEYMNRELTDIISKLEECKRNLSQAKDNLQKASEENSCHAEDKRQYLKFKGMVERNEISGDDLYLSKTTGNIIAPIFSSFLLRAAEQGIKLTPTVSEEVIRIEPALSVSATASSFKKLLKLRDNLLKASQNVITDAGIAQLKMKELDEQIYKITEKLADEDDGDERKRLKAERDKLRDEKEKLKSSGAFVPSDDELSLFDEERQKKFQTPEGQQQITQIISSVETDYKNVLQESLKQISVALESYQPHDIDALSEQVKSINGQIKHLNEEAQIKREEISYREKLGENLAQKYQCAIGEIETRIEGELNRLNEESKREAPIRQVWEDTLTKFTERLNNPETARDDEEHFKDIYISSCNVVGITCAANMREGLDKKFSDFDVVIIDEVSKATPPELLPALMRARKTILVGDHRQLPPVFDEYEKTYNELVNKYESDNVDDESDVDDEFDDNDSEIVLHKEDLKKYKDMVTASLFREYFEKADDKIKHTLSIQYRMHSDIMKVINRFYNGKLKSGVLETEEQTKAHNLNVKTDKGESFLNPDSHAYWIDSSTLHGKFMEQTQYPGSTSFYNVFERYIIISVLQKINDAYVKLGQLGITVGVISFYGSQVNDLRKAVKNLRNSGKLKALKVAVNTVDRFQGKEKQIIITDLVCNTNPRNASKHVAAFERINVAFSRAQNLLIIVGAQALYGRLSVSIPDMDTGEIKSARIYKNIIEDIAGNGARIAGETLIADADVSKIMDEYKTAKDKYKKAKEDSDKEAKAR